MGFLPRPLAAFQKTITDAVSKIEEVIGEELR